MSNNNNQYQNNNSGRDPTPYHYRSNPSTSPSFNNDKKKTSDASSRSGRDPPAKSPFPTSIHATPTHHSQQQQQQHGSSYTTGFATNKSTPNVHSHHYQKQQQQHQMTMVSTTQQQENELSMIQEDESHSGGGGGDYDGQSMVSNVTGSTFVRTPIIRKQHHQHHASNNNNHATTPRNNSGSGGGSASRTPRNTTQYTHTPGSITSTTIQHTPSTSQLINRPSLAMRESLAHLASSTSHALEEIWDSIGVSPDERASQLLNLVEEISSICDAKVANEERLRTQFQKEINEARCE